MPAQKSLETNESGKRASDSKKLKSVNFMGNFVSSLKVYFSRIPVEFKDATPCPDGNEAIPRSTPERENW